MIVVDAIAHIIVYRLILLLWLQLLFQN